MYYQMKVLFFNHTTLHFSVSLCSVTGIFKLTACLSHTMARENPVIKIYMEYLFIPLFAALDFNQFFDCNVRFIHP